MKKISIRTPWYSGYEDIEFDLSDISVAETQISTFEFRKAGGVVKYEPVLKIDLSKKIFDVFSLKYNTGGIFLNDNESGADGEIGVANYSLVNDKWHCSWKSDTGKELEDISCTTFDPEMEREMALVKHKIRDKKFRQMILLQDNHRCVITGEVEPCILDAAHIIEVQGKGNDFSTNGITLRKDLHALFDAGQFSIMQDGTLQFSKNLSAYYQELFSRAPSASLLNAASRVSRNLEIRKKNDAPKKRATNSTRAD